MNYFLFMLGLLHIFYTVNCQLTTTYVKPLANGTCGISTGGPLIQQLTTTLSCISGMFWSDSGEKIAYVDRFGPAFGRYTPSDGRFNRMAINEGKEAIAIFPVNNATGLEFVVGLDKRLVLASVTTNGTSLVSKTTDLMTVSSKSEVFMRGKVDSKGRLWYASRSEGLFSQGNLYKIENLGTPQIMVTGLNAGTGLAWTQDYKYLYLVDSDVGIIYKFDFNNDKGSISNKQIIFRLSNHTNIPGKPSDVVVDQTGYLWIAMYNGGVVIQYDEKTSTVLSTIAIPTSYLVALEFGGLDKKTLYVGTSKYFMNKSSSDPSAGAIFSVSGLGVTGIPDNDIVIPAKYVN